MSPTEAAEHASERALGEVRIICTREQRYSAALTPGLLAHGDERLLHAIGERRALVVTTPTVASLHGQRLREVLAPVADRVRVHVIRSGEAAKEMSSVLEVCAAAQEAGIGRRDVLVAFGGGLCCDVVTFAASLVRRGVAYLTVPTTLVGQVDAGIGLKGGVNFGGAKNYLGCFHPPERSLLDLRLLATLPAPELRCGLAEIVKMAVVRDPELFGVLRDRGDALVASRFAPSEDGVAAWVVERAVALMLAELEPNCYEDQTLRRLVDFGHTVSPALEERSGLRVRHGAAVAVDMALSCEIAAELGFLGSQECATVVDTLVGLGLPVAHPLLTDELVSDGLAGAQAHRGGAVNLVLPTRIGAAEFLPRREDLPLAAVTAALGRLHARAA